MNIAATLLLICLTSVAACSRLPQPTVQYGIIQSTVPSNVQQSDISVHLIGTLQCEPKGLTKLPQGECIGTPDAQPTLRRQTCICENENYVPIPTEKGHTCIHLVSVLETLRAVYQKIQNAGITEAESDLPAYNFAATMNRIIRQLDESSFQKRFVQIDESFDDIDVATETEEQNAKTRIDLSVLQKDLRKADRLLREHADTQKRDRTFRYIQIAMNQYLRVENAQTCLEVPESISRKKLFALYPPMQPFN